MAEYGAILAGAAIRVCVYDNMVDQGDRYSAEIYHTTTSLDVVSYPSLDNCCCHCKHDCLGILLTRSNTIDCVADA